MPSIIYHACTSELCLALFAMSAGKIAPLKGDIVLGSINCPYENNFKGFMDSVSVMSHFLPLSALSSV